MINPTECTSETFAGTGAKAPTNGALSAAAFNEPGGLAWLDGRLYVADTNNHSIRVIDPKTKTGILPGTKRAARNCLNTARDNSRAGRSVCRRLTIQPGTTQLALSFALPEGYKLSSQRTALSAMEPVRPRQSSV